MNTVVAIPFTSNLVPLEYEPNILFKKEETGLSKDSVAVIHLIGAVNKFSFERKVSKLSEENYQKLANYVDERPAQFSDNKARIECADVYVHLFTPLSFDYMELKRSLRDSLEQNAFLVSSIQSYLEQDTNIRHTVFECEISQERSK